jgi:hypothetical protein
VAQGPHGRPSPHFDPSPHPAGGNISLSPGRQNVRSAAGRAQTTVGGCPAAAMTTTGAGRACVTTRPPVPLLLPQQRAETAARNSGRLIVIQGMAWPFIVSLSETRDR